MDTVKNILTKYTQKVVNPQIAKGVQPEIDNLMTVDTVVDDSIKHIKNIPSTYEENSGVIEDIGGLSYKSKNLIDYMNVDWSNPGGLDISKNTQNNTITVSGTGYYANKVFKNISLNKDQSITFSEYINSLDLGDAKSIFASILIFYKDGTYDNKNTANFKSNQHFFVTITASTEKEIDSIEIRFARKAENVSNYTVVVSQLQLEYGSVATNYEPHFDELRDTKTIELISSGKNLFGFEKRTKGKLTGDGGPSGIRNWEYDKYYVGFFSNNYVNTNSLNSYSIEPNKITVNAKIPGAGLAFPVSCKPNTQYTSSMKYDDKIHGRLAFSFFTKTGVYISVVGYGGGLPKKTFTTPKNCYTMVLVFRPTVGFDVTYTDNMLSLQDIPYTPYIEPQKYTIPTEIQNIDGYGKGFIGSDGVLHSMKIDITNQTYNRDFIYDKVDSPTCRLTKIWKVVGDYTKFAAYPRDYWFLNGTSVGGSNTFSNEKLIGVAETEAQGLYWYHSSNNQFVILSLPTAVASTLEEAHTYLEKHPVEFLALSETPITGDLPVPLNPTIDFIDNGTIEFKNEFNYDMPNTIKCITQQTKLTIPPSVDPTPKTIIERDLQGCGFVETPEDNDDLSNKDYVDSKVSITKEQLDNLAKLLGGIQ